jgi:late competence protein required for DNA uptake (superfamily II DNA/RNA helicase)
MTVEISAKERFILSLDRNLCKTCGEDSVAAVQLYPSQAWEYYCKKCYDKKKHAS